MEKKELQVENCGIALFAEGKENQWYIDSGCSKHMTGDKNKLLSYSALEKEKNVTFGNDTPTVIKGKGSVNGLEQLPGFDKWEGEVTRVGSIVVRLGTRRDKEEHHIHDLFQR